MTHDNQEDRHELTTGESSRQEIQVHSDGEIGIRPSNGREVMAEQAEAGKTTTGQDTPPSFVFAIGRAEPRCPSIGVEKELAQATGRSDLAGKNDRGALQAVLAEPVNRYLVRSLRWVLTIEGLETYLLTPRDPADFTLLTEALRPNPRPTDIDVVIGMIGPVAPPEYANGLVLPIVFFDQLFSFDTDTLISNIPKPDSFSGEDFQSAAEELYYRIAQIADNAGNTDEHRALNYLAVRYPAIYSRVTEAFAQNSALASVRARPSRLSGPRRIVDVIFSFRNRETDFEESSFVRVDVTEEFPFLVTKLGPYIER